MTENYFGKKNGDVTGLLENLHTNLAASIKEYEENGYPYDFYITSVSGVFRIMRRSTRPLQIRLRCLMKIWRRSHHAYGDASGIV